MLVQTELTPSTTVDLNFKLNHQLFKQQMRMAYRLDLVEAKKKTPVV